MKLHRGSFTIEAVIWIPLILGMMLSVLQQGIYFYKESVYREVSQENRDWDVVARFYEAQAIKETVEGWKDE